MKRKSLLIATLVSALTIGNCFAMEITKGKLLNHKEFTTGDAKIVFQDKNFKMNDKLKELQNKYFDTLGDYIGVLGNIDNESTTVNQPIDIKGAAEIAVSNDTSVIQTYKIVTTLATWTPDNGMITGTSVDTVSLEPSGSISLLRKPILSYSFDKAGNYTTYIMVAAQKENDATIFRSFAEGTIKVFDNAMVSTSQSK